MSGFYPDKDSPIEILDDQNKLSAFWNKLNNLNRINISTPLDVETSAVVTTRDADFDKIEGVRGKPATEIKAIGLEKGKLVAIKWVYRGPTAQWETFHLLRVKKDGRFATEFPITQSPLEIEFSEKPIVVYPDDESFKTIRVEKTPAGFKIGQSSRDNDPAYTHDRTENYLIYSPTDTEFYTLDPKTSEEARKLQREINR